MALAYLELTEIAAGSVLQRSGVSTAEQLVGSEPMLPDAINRIRVFAQAHESTGGAPGTTMVNLYLAALRSLDPLERLVARNRQSGTSYRHAPLFALWSMHAPLKELHNQSLADAFEMLRGGGIENDCVLVELDDPAPDAIRAAKQTIARYYDSFQAALSTPQPVLKSSRATNADARVDEAPARRRAELASTWPTAAEVSRKLGSSADNASHLASSLRRDGRLLGVYLPIPSPSYRYPSWQFGDDGLPIRLIPEILAVLREKGPFKMDDHRRTSGWGEVEWFRSRHALLNGERPADVLATDPGAVLRAAQIEFGEDG